MVIKDRIILRLGRASGHDEEEQAFLLVGRTRDCFAGYERE